MVRTPTEKVREVEASLQDWSGGAGARSPPAAGKTEVKLGSDSCYSRSDNSSTDSDCPNSARGKSWRPPARGDTDLLMQDQLEAARLERLCPRVRSLGTVLRGRQPHYTDTTSVTSLSSLDTSSSSDLWGLQACQGRSWRR